MHLLSFQVICKFHFKNIKAKKVVKNNLRSLEVLQNEAALDYISVTLILYPSQYSK